MIITTKKQFDELIKKQDKLYIYGAGKWGRKVVDYLYMKKWQNKVDNILVTSIEKNQNEYRGIPIIGFKKEYCNDACILICVKERNDICEYMTNIGIDNYIELDNVSFLIEDEEEKIEKNDNWYNFVVAGWPKCGTTTLQAVMQTNKNIYLPIQKETFFYAFRNKVDEPKEVLKKVFFGGIEEGQLAGSIEPTFVKCARLLKEDFGKQLKIILILRNPVYALFSMYRMQMKKGNAVCGYGNYQEYTHEIFDNYCDQALNQSNLYLYDKYVEEYLDTFGLGNLHIVLLEDLVREPKKVIERIYEFLEVEGKYDLGDLPKENEGNYVFATREGYLVAEKIYELERNMHQNPEVNVYETDEYKKLAEKYHEAEKIYNPQMETYQRERVQDFFNESVRNLENLINRNLSEVWF